MTSSNCMTFWRLYWFASPLSAAEIRDATLLFYPAKDLYARRCRPNRPRTVAHQTGGGRCRSRCIQRTVQFVAAVGLTACMASTQCVRRDHVRRTGQRQIEHNIITFPTPSVSAGAAANASIWPPGCPLTGFDEPPPPSVQLKTRRVCAFASSAGRSSKREYSILARAADWSALNEGLYGDPSSMTCWLYDTRQSMLHMRGRDSARPAAIINGRNEPPAPLGPVYNINRPFSGQRAAVQLAVLLTLFRNTHVTSYGGSNDPQ